MGKKSGVRHLATSHKNLLFKTIGSYKLLSFHPKQLNLTSISHKIMEASYIVIRAK